jgi:hypothetical protein
VWIEHEDSIYGKSIGDIQKKLLDEKGVKVLGQGAHNFQRRRSDRRRAAHEGANPDVWLMTGYVPTATSCTRRRASRASSRR